MRSILFLLALCALPHTMPALDISSMSPEQRIELGRQLEQANKPSAVQIREETEKWADLGKNVGLALVAVSKEMGVAAAEFAQTPLGKVVVGLLVFKIMGAAIIGMFWAAVLICMGVGFFWYIHNRILRTPIYEYKPYLWGGWNRKVLKGYEKNNDRDDNTDGWQVCSVLLPAMCLIGASFAAYGACH